MSRSLLSCSLHPLHRRLSVPHPRIASRPINDIRIRWLNALQSSSFSINSSTTSTSTSASSHATTAVLLSSHLRRPRCDSSSSLPLLSHPPHPPPRRWFSSPPSHPPPSPPQSQGGLLSPALWMGVLVIGVAVAALVNDFGLLKADSPKSAFVNQRAEERRERRKSSDSGDREGEKRKEKEKNDSGTNTSNDREGGEIGQGKADEKADEGETEEEKVVDGKKEDKGDEDEGKEEEVDDKSNGQTTDNSAAPNVSGGGGDRLDEQAAPSSRTASPPSAPPAKGQKTVESDDGVGHQHNNGAAEHKDDGAQEKGPPSKEEAADEGKASKGTESDGGGHRTPPPLSAEEAAAEAAHLSSYYSAPRDEHPFIPNLRILTANRIDSVLQSSPPFLLYLYDPTCAACSLYSPIINALAYALDTRDPTSPPTSPSPSPPVLVYSMNDATDYKPGFLTLDEERALPLLKFFPQSPTQQPLAYNGSPHLSSLLAFLHRHSGGAFDLPRALERAKSRLPQLRKEVEEKGKARLERSEDWMLFLGSPCGRWIRDYSVSELKNKYVEGEVEGEGEREAEAKYDRFVKCMEDKEEESLEYFETMQQIAAETVSEMRKKRAKRQMEGRNDSTMVQEDDVEKEEDTEDAELGEEASVIFEEDVVCYDFVIQIAVLALLVIS